MPVSQKNELDDYLNSTSLVAITDKTIIDKNKLIENIKLTKQRGYSIEKGENEKDVICVGFPIYKNNCLYGAFSITAPAYRVTNETLQGFIVEGLKAKQEILDKL